MRVGRTRSSGSGAAAINGPMTVTPDNEVNNGAKEIGLPVSAPKEPVSKRADSIT